MKNILFLMVMVVVAMHSCKKDEEFTKIELLCNKDWTLNAWTLAYTYGGITNTADIYHNPGLMDAPDCLLDDYINFDADKTFSTKPGVNQCNLSLLGSGDWAFNANEAVLSISSYGDTLPTDYNIITLDENTCSLSTIQTIELDVSGTSVFVDGTFNMSFVH